MKTSYKTLKFASIDIGSNAIRLLISNVYIISNKHPESTKNSLVRVPIRLGEDAFNYGKIREENIIRLIDAIKSFKLLMKVNNVKQYRGYGTSALRCSENKVEILNRIKDKTGIEVEIIDGNKEAKLITKNKIFQNDNKLFCIIDVGGGSTELTLLKNNSIIKSKSFKIGGVRLINNLVTKEIWLSFNTWIKKNLSNMSGVSVVGFGGNINKIFKLSGNNIGKSLSLKKITSTLNKLECATIEEKILNLKLNPDRLDVIVPAGRVYEHILKIMSVREIEVPKVGLADGMISELIEEL
ncbi:MAG: exopolyphosphatase [Flavobacteriaceae bacterium]|nr:exopolyphosphatase [Flavobacteriaceae bacterium]